MNYENAKGILRKDMRIRNCAVDTQNKLIRALKVFVNIQVRLLM